MKSVLSQWYEPEDSDMQEFMQTGTIALDANVLLSLYRVSGTQRSQILDVLEGVSDRLWIPYQVALEYQRNRLSVASDIHKMFDMLEDIPAVKVEEAFADAIAALMTLSDEAAGLLRDREMKELVKEEFKNSIELIERVSDQTRQSMSSKFSSIRDNHAIRFQNAKDGDPVRAVLDRLFTVDRIGEAPDVAKLAELKRAAQGRIDMAIPPGYKDVKNKKDPTGDCLVWFELLDHAKLTQRRILFVTDDVKEDFYRRVHGQTIGPRIELIEEMSEEAGQPFHQTTLDGFLRLANTYLKAAVPEETISTVVSGRETQHVAMNQQLYVDYSNHLDKLGLSATEREVAFAFLADMEDGRSDSKSSRRTVSAMNHFFRDIRTAASRKNDLDSLMALCGIEEMLYGTFGRGTSSTRMHIIDLLISNKRYEEALSALAEIDRIESSGPRRIAIARRRAEVLAALGMNDAAIDVLDSELRQYRTAAIYDGHVESARKLLKQLRSDAPDEG